MHLFNSAPDVLDILRDSFKYSHIPQNNRVLYIVPLVAIVDSLEKELSRFDIAYEVLGPEHQSKGSIDKDSKVIIVTPEKIVKKNILETINDLDWLAIVIDEPQYILSWGTSKKKKGVLKKPFREAFQQLNRLNVTGSPFELHTATAKDLDKIFTLLGRKDSEWLKQIVLPERENLTYFLIDGKNITDIKQFAFVRNHLEVEDAGGALLIYVNKLEEGSRIYYSLNEYAIENGLVRWSSRKRKPTRPVAFLNANLEEKTKSEIMKDVSEGVIRVLVATSSMGAGVNLPFKTVLGWGLHPEPEGLVQASGRAGRKPLIDRGDVIWVSK